MVVYVKFIGVKWRLEDSSAGRRIKYSWWILNWKTDLVIDCWCVISCDLELRRSIDFGHWLWIEVKEEIKKKVKVERAFCFVDTHQ